MNIVKLVGRSISTKSKKRIKRFILSNIRFDPLVSTYDSWVIKNFPDALEILKQKSQISELAYKPIISIVVPVYNTPERYLDECVGSVLTQSYDNWELVLVDDASSEVGVCEKIKHYAAQDDRIKYKLLVQNQHIAGATNEAIQMSTGEYVSLLDHDDILWPNALFEVVKALNVDRRIDFLYTDEDKIVEERYCHAEPFFKPDWSPSLLRTCNYITHFSVFKRELLDTVGYEDGTYNGAQDWEIIMRATRRAKKVHHIAKVLYSWRVHDNSTAKSVDTKPYVVEAQRAVIVNDLSIRGYNDKDFSVDQRPGFSAFWKTTLMIEGEPKVTIVILDKKQAAVLSRKTSYRNCEFIVAQSYREGAERATGEYLVFFERGIGVMSKEWVQVLLNDAIRSDAGLVGGLTLYVNGGYIYSAGIAVNNEGRLAHSLSGGVSINSLKTWTRSFYAHTLRDTTALSGCVMVKKEKLANFQFNDNRDTTEQLVTMAAELIERGFCNIYDPEFVNVKQEKYVEKRSRNNKQRRLYSDRLTGTSLNQKKYKTTFAIRFFYDDLVSCPDVN